MKGSRKVRLSVARHHVKGRTEHETTEEGNPFGRLPTSSNRFGYSQSAAPSIYPTPILYFKALFSLPPMVAVCQVVVVVVATVCGTAAEKQPDEGGVGRCDDEVSLLLLVISGFPIRRMPVRYRRRM